MFFQWAEPGDMKVTVIIILMLPTHEKQKHQQ